MQRYSGADRSAARRGADVGVTALVISALAFVVAVVMLVGLTDWALLGRAFERVVDDPAGLALIAGVLLGAFSLRALAWIGLLPGLRFATALSAIHLALGANHVLPFRLGEPLRVVAAVRRGGVDLGPAATSTVVLRTADLVALLLIGLVAGPRFMTTVLGRWGLALVAGLVLVGLVVVVVVGIGPARFGRTATGHRLSSTAVALTGGAWALEAVVVWRVATWFDVDLTASEALVVLAVAVGSQVLAVTPAGVGTYEAAASAALVATGVPVPTALALAVTLHGVKTIYSLLAGGLAVFRPGPSLLGRLRLAQWAPVAPSPPVDPEAPVVLFLPANDEGPRIAEVIASAPNRVAGHRVEVVVVDDGSTDDTAALASLAGADVVCHGHNRGLGAAVRTGLAVGVERRAAAVAFCDADGEYDPAQLADLVRPVLTGRAHYVVGSRFSGHIAHMRPHRRFGNRVLTGVVRFIVRQPVTDGQSGYRALSASAAASARIPHDYNYAQVLTIDLVGRGLGYHEVPIRYRFRTSGRSFVRLGPYLRRVVPTIWRQLNQTLDPDARPALDVRPNPERMEYPPWPSESDSSPVPSP